VIDSVVLERTPVAENSETSDAQPSRVWLALALGLLVTVFLSVGLFGFHPSVVTSGSMEPGWHRGDVVVTRSVDADTLRVGDVITFAVGGARVVHRIVEIDQSSDGRVLVTRGDNNPVADQPVREKAVEGKVLFSVPAAGHPILFLQSLLAKVR
jgi:signal peptidase I